MPHRRIAAWAREIVDDFHAIEEAHKGKRLTESGDDPGETLAIKRCLSVLKKKIKTIVIYYIVNIF